MQLELDFDIENKIIIEGSEMYIDSSPGFLGFCSLAFKYPLVVNYIGDKCFVSKKSVDKYFKKVKK